MTKQYMATINQESTQFSIEEKDGLVCLKLDDRELDLDVHYAGPHHYTVLFNGQSYNLRFFHEENNVQAFLHGEHLYFKLEDAKSARRHQAEEEKKTSTADMGRVELKAQMPGKVVGVKVNEGDNVKEGQGIVVLEAMKMENEVTSPKAGKVLKIAVSEGQSVESGALLAVIE